MIKDAAARSIQIWWKYVKLIRQGRHLKGPKAYYRVKVTATRSKLYSTVLKWRTLKGSRGMYEAFLRIRRLISDVHVLRNAWMNAWMNAWEMPDLFSRFSCSFLVVCYPNIVTGWSYFPILRLVWRCIYSLFRMPWWGDAKIALMKCPFLASFSTLWMHHLNQLS